MAMCLLFFIINNCPKSDEFKMILVNNRDELYSRPTEGAHPWGDDPLLVAGWYACLFSVPAFTSPSVRTCRFTWD